MDRRVKVEPFEVTHREQEFGEDAIWSAARKLGVHRGMVREAIRNAIPSARKKPPRDHWKLKTLIPQIEAVLVPALKTPD